MWGWVARVSPPFYWVLKKGKEIEKKEKERITEFSEILVRLPFSAF
jgi:hypothetical protein